MEIDRCGCMACQTSGGEACERAAPRLTPYEFESSGGPGISTWETGRPWWTAAEAALGLQPDPLDSLSSEMQRLERENAALKSELGAKNARLSEALDRLAQIERDEDHRKTLAR